MHEIMLNINKQMAPAIREDGINKDPPMRAVGPALGSVGPEAEAASSAEERDRNFGVPSWMRRLNAPKRVAKTGHGSKGSSVFSYFAALDPKDLTQKALLDKGKTHYCTTCVGHMGRSIEAAAVTYNSANMAKHFRRKANIGRERVRVREVPRNGGSPSPRRVRGGGGSPSPRSTQIRGESESEKSTGGERVRVREEYRGRASPSPRRIRGRASPSPRRIRGRASPSPRRIRGRASPESEKNTRTSESESPRIRGRASPSTPTASGYDRVRVLLVSSPNPDRVLLITHTRPDG